MQQAVAMLRRVGGSGSQRLAAVPAMMQLQRHMAGCKLFVGGMPIWASNVLYISPCPVLRHEFGAPRLERDNEWSRARRSGDNFVFSASYLLFICTFTFEFSWVCLAAVCPKCLNFNIPTTFAGLPWEANEETLKDAFSSFGDVQDGEL